MKMSPLPSLVSRVSTVSGGGAVPVVVLPAMELPPGRSTGPWEHAETHATARAQAAPVTRTAISRGRDGRLPAARGLAPGGAAGPCGGAETRAPPGAQPARVTRPSLSRGRDGRLPVARGLRLTRGR